MYWLHISRDSCYCVVCTRSSFFDNPQFTLCFLLVWLPERLFATHSAHYTLETTQARPITSPVISLLLLFVSCCEENPTGCVCFCICVCLCMCVIVCVSVCVCVCVCVCWDVKGRSHSMCCWKRVSVSPGWAGLESAAHWPEAACLHRTEAMTSECVSARGEETEAWTCLSLSWALVTQGCTKSTSWI